MRNRISAAVIGILSLASLTCLLRSAARPADQPTPTPAPRPAGIFSEVGGWITYSDADGIWAVDPSDPGDREGRVQLSSNGGIPLAWSSDGSELLISRESWVLLSRRQLRHGTLLGTSRPTGAPARIRA
jgi:hypothetical protein